MGVPDIKYGDSVCYIQHVDTGLWLTYQSVDAKCARMGGVQRKVSPSLSLVSTDPEWIPIVVWEQCAQCALAEILQVSGTLLE